MLAYFYIPRLKNDMKLAVQNNHLGGKILYSPSSRTTFAKAVLFRIRNSVKFQKNGKSFQNIRNFLKCSLTLMAREKL